MFGMALVLLRSNQTLNISASNPSMSTKERTNSAVHDLADGLINPANLSGKISVPARKPDFEGSYSNVYRCKWEGNEVSWYYA
jgi:hypothetical protein